MTVYTHNIMNALEGKHEDKGQNKSVKPEEIMNENSPHRVCFCTE